MYEVDGDRLQLLNRGLVKLGMRGELLREQDEEVYEALRDVDTYDARDALAQGMGLYVVNDVAGNAFYACAVDQASAFSLSRQEFLRALGPKKVEGDKRVLLADLCGFMVILMLEELFPEGAPREYLDFNDFMDRAYKVMDGIVGKYANIPAEDRPWQYDLAIRFVNMEPGEGLTVNQGDTRVRVICIAMKLMEDAKLLVSNPSVSGRERIVPTRRFRALSERFIFASQDVIDEIRSVIEATGKGETDEAL